MGTQAIYHGTLWQGFQAQTSKKGNSIKYSNGRSYRFSKPLQDSPKIKKMTKVGNANFELKIRRFLHTSPVKKKKIETKIKRNPRPI